MKCDFNSKVKLKSNKIHTIYHKPPLFIPMHFGTQHTILKTNFVSTSSCTLRHISWPPSAANAAIKHRSRITFVWHWRHPPSHNKGEPLKSMSATGLLYDKPLYSLSGHIPAIRPSCRKLCALCY